MGELYGVRFSHRLGWSGLGGERGGRRVGGIGFMGGGLFGRRLGATVLVAADSCAHFLDTVILGGVLGLISRRRDVFFVKWGGWEREW